MSVPDDLRRELFEAGDRAWEEFRAHASARHHLFIPSDPGEVYAGLVPLVDRAHSFLELGSAAGVITILADLLGFEAYGIELEPWLVGRSVELAERFGSGATFAEGTFVPEDYQNVIEDLPADFETPDAGADAYDELGLELDEFDLVFNYPWPGTEDWLQEMMHRHARRDALLLTFDAKEGLRLDEGPWGH